MRYSSSLKRSRSYHDSPEEQPHKTSRTTVSKGPVLEAVEMNSLLRIVRVHAKARVPIRSTPGAAGYDLCSAVDTTIAPNSRGLVNTGLIIQVPQGTYGRVAPRSGLTLKHFIDTGAGVIDEDYRGELKVVLFNFGDQPFHIRTGDRIAQLILEKIMTPGVIEVPTLDSTDRGSGGFGSTGGSGTSS